MSCLSRRGPVRPAGFTLVEIMVVVVILGLLVSMAMPAFQKVRNNSLSSRIANDFRIFAYAFETCALEAGTWPPDGNANEIPLLAQPYIKSSNWNRGAVSGSWWDWEGAGRHGVSASINFVDQDQNLPTGVMERVDELLDNGNLGTGIFRRVGGNEYIYILAP